MMKKIFAVVFIVIMLIIFFVIFVITNKCTSDFSDLSIHDISLYENTFKATAMQLSSGKSIRNYSYTVNNDSLYITIYSGMVTRKHQSGTLYINFTDSQLCDIKTVYLQNGESVKLIYPIN